MDDPQHAASVPADAKALGVGEAVAAVVPAAISNAVFDAVGLRLALGTVPARESSGSFEKRLSAHCHSTWPTHLKQVQTMTNIFHQLSHVARVALIALTLPMVFGHARASEVNMWFDETGEVHYSDIPPADVKAHRVPQSQTFRAGMKAQGMSRSGPSPIAGTTAPDSTSDAEPVYTENQQSETAAQAPADRRHKMIEDCENNDGLDCEREVDTELGAEGIQHDGHVIHEVRRPGAPKH